MKFKIDENLPVELKSDLSTAGHDAETIVDEGLTGAPDPDVVRQSQHERRVLLTMDKGIADVRAYPPDQYSGIVLFRPATQGRAATLRFVRRHLVALLTAELDGHLLVVSDSGIRIR
jgi:predicted nuclease of predicted toxin-antitoxin system